MVLLCDGAYGKYIPKLVCKQLQDQLKPKSVATKARKLVRLANKLDDADRYGTNIKSSTRQDIEETLQYLWDDITGQGYVLCSIGSMYGKPNINKTYSFLPKRLRWVIEQDDDVWLVPQTDYVVPMWLAMPPELKVRYDDPKISIAVRLEQEFLINEDTTFELTYQANLQEHTVALKVENGTLIVEGDEYDFPICKLIKQQDNTYKLPKHVSSLHKWEFINLIVFREKAYKP
jgi:hypothetical protein